MPEDQRERGIIGRLHVITDYHFQQRFTHAELAAMAISGGADTVQFRQKHGLIRHQLAEAHATAAVCHGRNIPLIIDDDLGIALAVNASGIHLGQEDFPVKSARTVLGPQRLIGATATTIEQALLAEKNGADYIGFGPVFRTNSKSNPASVKGLLGLSEVCRSVSIPVIAIAGITAERIESVIETGAFGVAVMTAVTNAENPERSAAKFRRELDRLLT